MLKFLGRHREFIGHVGTIISGRTIAAVVGLLVTPVVARLFLPSDFGVAASFLGLAGIGAQVASLRYESAVVLPKNDDEALLLVALSNRILPAFCFLLFGAIVLLKAGGIRWQTLDLLGAWVWVLPLTILLMGATDIQESWLARKRKYGVVSKSVVIDTAFGGAARIGFGVLGGSSVYGLVFGHLTGVIGRLTLQGQAGPEGFRATFRRIEWPVLRGIALRYADFAKLNAPAGLIYSMGQNLPVIMFGIMFSPAVAGFFAMANRISNLPVIIVGSSVRRVFLQKAAVIHNDGRSLRRSFLMTTLGLLALGVAPCAVVWMYGQPVLGWLLGNRWLAAGRYLEIIAPWVLTAWASAPCNPIFIVLRKQKQWLVQQTCVTVVRLSAFGIGYALDLGAERTLGLFVVFAIAGNAATLISAFMLTGKVEKHVDPMAETQERQERFFE